MPGFIDASCPKCRTRIGWCGTMLNNPGCHRCGWKPDPDELARCQKQLDDAEREIMDRLRKNPMPAKWREARVEAKIPLRDAAKQLGISAKELSDVESGRAKPRSTLVQQLNQLYNLAEEPNAAAKGD